MANNIRTIGSRQTRGVGNVVFYVEQVQKQAKNEKWNDPEWMVRVKHYNKDSPFQFDHCPSDEELKKLWRWQH
jgi:hypothetical protein